LKEEALDCTMWRARFGRGFGPVVRQTTKWMGSITLQKLQVNLILLMEIHIPLLHDLEYLGISHKKYL